MARWQDYVLRGVRADQPAASVVAIGTLYCVTDESNILERSNGTTWDEYSPTTVAVDVDVAGALDGDGTVGDPLAVRPDNVTITINGSNQLEVVSAALDAARDTNGFRLTLASGQPAYLPQSATPASTDTTNEIVTFSADPGWYDGTIVTVSATVGGLTAGTRYYLHRISSLTYSFHTTVAAAMAGTSRVDLTANITSVVIPSGISTTGVYLTPYLSSQIALYDGYDWVLVDHAEFSVGLGTLTADTNYDLFVDYNGGTPQLSIGAAWTSATVRSVALVRQDGVLVSSADAQSRYVGTFRTDSTTTTIDDAGGIATQVGGKRFLFNYSNRIMLPLRVKDTTATWAYANATIRVINGATAPLNCVEVLLGVEGIAVEANYWASVNLASNSARTASVSIGVDSSVAYAPQSTAQPAFNGTATLCVYPLTGAYKASPGVGYHFISALESGADGTSTFRGTGATDVNGMNGFFFG